MRVRRFYAVIGLVAVLLAGCRVDARVQINLDDDGSGTITTTLKLDQAAVQRVGGPERLGDEVPLDDLAAADWKISSWTEGLDGAYSVTLARDFTSEEDLNRRLEDLTGSDGALRDAEITHKRGGLSSTDALSLTVDGTDPAPGILADTTLAKQLRAFGIDPAAMEEELAKELRTSMHLTVAVTLPDGTEKVVTATPNEPQTLRASHSAQNWDHITQLGIALALALLAGLFFVSFAVSSRRNRRRQAQRVRYDNVDRAPLM
jgi:hypothetical protein